MLIKQESIRSIMSNKIIPLPAWTYISWGVLSGLMISLTMPFSSPIEVIVILTIGCLLGITFHIWDLSRHNMLFELFKFSNHQKDNIFLLLTFLLFSACLTVFFIFNNTPSFITPVWMFAIGVFNYMVGSYSGKKLLLSYSRLLIFVSFIIFIGIMFFPNVQEEDIHFLLSVTNIVILSFGHIGIGVYYLSERKEALNAQ